MGFVTRTKITTQTRTERYDSDNNGTLDATRQVVDQIVTTETYYEPDAAPTVTTRVDTYLDANKNGKVDPGERMLRSQPNLTGGHPVYSSGTGNVSADSASALAAQFGIPADVAQTLVTYAGGDAARAMEAVADTAQADAQFMGQLGDEVTAAQIQQWRKEGYKVVLWNPSGVDIEDRPIGADAAVTGGPLSAGQTAGPGDPVYDLTHSVPLANGEGWQVMVVAPPNSSLPLPTPLLSPADGTQLPPLPQGDVPIGGPDSNVTMSDITNAVGLTNSTVSLEQFYAARPELAAQMANAATPQDAIALAGQALGWGTPVLVDMEGESGQALLQDAQENGVTYVGYNDSSAYQGNQGLVTMAGPNSENGLANLVDLNRVGGTSSTVVVAFIPPPEGPTDLSPQTYVPPTRRAELDELSAQVSSWVNEGYSLSEALATSDPPIVDYDNNTSLLTGPELNYFTSQIVAQAQQGLDQIAEAYGGEEYVDLPLLSPDTPPEIRQALAQSLVGQLEAMGTTHPARSTTLAMWALNTASGAAPPFSLEVDTEQFDAFVSSLSPSQLQSFTQALALGQDERSLGTLQTVSAILDAEMASPDFMQGGPGFQFAATVLSGPMAPPDTAFNLFEQSPDFANSYLDFAGKFLSLDGSVEYTPEDAARIDRMMRDDEVRATLGNMPFSQRLLVTSYLISHDEIDASKIRDAGSGGLLGAVLVDRHAAEVASAQNIPFEQAYRQVLDEYQSFDSCPGSYATHLAVQGQWDTSVAALLSGGQPRLSDGSPLTQDSYINVDAATLAKFPQLAPLMLPTTPPVLPQANVLAAVQSGALTARQAADILDQLAAQAEFDTSPDRLHDAAGGGVLGTMAEAWITISAGNPYTETGLADHGSDEAARLRELAAQIRTSTDPNFVASAFTLALDHTGNVYQPSKPAFAEAVMQEYGQVLDVTAKVQLGATVVMVLGSLGAGLAAGAGGGAIALSTMAEISAVQGFGSFAINAANNYATTGDPHWADALGAGVVDGFTSLLGMRFGMIKGLSPLVAIGGSTAINVGGATLSAVMGQPGGVQALLTGDFSNIDMGRVGQAALISGAFSVGFGGGMYFLGGAKGANAIPLVGEESALSGAQIDDIAQGLSNGTLLVRNAEGAYVPAADVINPSAEGYYAVFRNSTTGQYDVRLVFSSDTTSLDPMAAITAQRSNWPGEGWEPVMGFHNHPNGAATVSAGDLGADDLFRQVFGPGFKSAVLTDGDGGFTLTQFQGDGTVRMPDKYLPWNGGQAFSDDPMADWSAMSFQQQMAAESQQTVSSLRSTWTPVAQDPQTGGVLWQLPNGRRFVEYPNGIGRTSYRMLNVTDEVPAGTVPDGWMPIMSQPEMLTAQEVEMTLAAIGEQGVADSGVHYLGWSNHAARWAAGGSTFRTGVIPASNDGAGGSVFMWSGAMIEAPFRPNQVGFFFGPELPKMPLSPLGDMVGNGNGAISLTSPNDPAATAVKFIIVNAEPIPAEVLSGIDVLNATRAVNGLDPLPVVTWNDFSTGYNALVDSLNAGAVPPAP